MGTLIDVPAFLACYRIQFLPDHYNDPFLSSVCVVSNLDLGDSHPKTSVSGRPTSVRNEAVDLPWLFSAKLKVGGRARKSAAGIFLEWATWFGKVLEDREIPRGRETCSGKIHTRHATTSGRGLHGTRCVQPQTTKVATVHHTWCYRAFTMAKTCAPLNTRLKGWWCLGFGQNRSTKVRPHLQSFLNIRDLTS